MKLYYYIFMVLANIMFMAMIAQGGFLIFLVFPLIAIICFSILIGAWLRDIGQIKFED